MKADCHIHMALDGANYRTAIARHRIAPDIPFIRRTLEKYRSLGYTYLRDGGDKWGVCTVARSLAPEYGITYRIPLAPLCHAGHYGSFIGESYLSLKEFASLVASRRSCGADFIKIMISGLMDFDRFGVLTEPGLPASEIRELIHIAHDTGFAVMAHANGTQAVLAAAEAGVDSVEHGAFLHPDALHAMVSAGTVWVPTLSTIANLRSTGRYDEKAVQAILDNATESVALFAAMGGLLAPGSDAGAFAVPHGCNTEEALLSAVDFAPGLETIQSKFKI